MKSLIITGFLIVGLLNKSTATAGDKEWATVGKVLTGVAAVQIVHRIIEPPQPTVIYVQSIPVQQQVVVIQQPVIVQSVPVYYSTPVIVYQPVYHRRVFWHHH